MVSSGLGRARRAPKVPLAASPIGSTSTTLAWWATPAFSSGTHAGRHAGLDLSEQAHRQNGLDIQRVEPDDAHQGLVLDVFAGIVQTRDDHAVDRAADPATIERGLGTRQLQSIQSHVILGLLHTPARQTGLARGAVAILRRGDLRGLQRRQASLGAPVDPVRGLAQAELGVGVGAKAGDREIGLFQPRIEAGDDLAGTRPGHCGRPAPRAAGPAPGCQDRRSATG